MNGSGMREKVMKNGELLRDNANALLTEWNKFLFLFLLEGSITTRY